MKIKSRVMPAREVVHWEMEKVSEIFVAAFEFLFIFFLNIMGGAFTVFFLRLLFVCVCFQTSQIYGSCSIRP